jgi:hypothetical protein
MGDCKKCFFAQIIGDDRQNVIEEKMNGISNGYRRLPSAVFPSFATKQNNALGAPEPSFLQAFDLSFPVI